MDALIAACSLAPPRLENGAKRVAARWEAALKHILKTRSPEGEQASIEACVYAWLDAGAAVLSRQKPLWTPEGYDLRLMSVAAADGLVNEGRNLVIVALVGTDIGGSYF